MAKTAKTETHIVNISTKDLRSDHPYHVETAGKKEMAVLKIAIPAIDEGETAEAYVARLNRWIETKVSGPYQPTEAPTAASLVMSAARLLVSTLVRRKAIKEHGVKRTPVDEHPEPEGTELDSL